MKTKIIFDLSVYGLALSHLQSQTGIYRVVDEMLNQFRNHPKLDVSYSHTSYTDKLSYTWKYLEKNGLSNKLANSTVNHFPASVFGRGHRYFRKLYSAMGIETNKLTYRDKSFRNADIFHSTFTRIPVETKQYPTLKRAITIYDLIALLRPEYHTMKDELNEIVKSVGNDYAICISEYTKNDLLSFDKNIQPDNVFVSYLAADSSKFYVCNNSERFLLIKEKYSLPDKYFLSLCTLEPRKNLDHLIRSFVRFIREQHISDLFLVLVGTKGWMLEKIDNALGDARAYRDRIILTDRIPDEDLATVYSNAHSFYYMSLYEGFGLPPLEAMQCGVATVTSNASSLPEVVADAGIMTDPYNEDDLCDAMYKFYYDNNIRNKYQKKGLERAKLFSWAKCAQDHIKIYQEIKNRR